MQIKLHPELQKFVEEKVRAGEFDDADCVINCALAVLRTHDLTPEEVNDLRREIDIGVAQADRGEFVDFTAEEIIAEGEAELRRRRGKGSE
jgi:antitoxin ParD1/3/4